MSFLKRMFSGDHGTAELRKLKPYVEKINAFEAEMAKLSTEELPQKTKEFKSRLEKGESLDDLLPEAFALVRETAKRTLGQRHFDVQLLGGLVLHFGNIAEMKTGEGKTLVATLPVYLNALSGRGVHVITVNDYLSRRDAVWMGQIYATLGLSVGIINSQQSFLYDPAHLEHDKERDKIGAFKVLDEFLVPCSRREAYDADITYGTNSEFGFDYLRDNLEYEPQALRQREFHYAVVDEIDSILIDEARTPLIISAPTNPSESLYGVFARIAEKLKEGEDFEADEKHKAIQLKDSGIEKAEKALGVDNIYTDKGIKYVHHLETAVKAKALYKKDVEYVVRDGEIIIVDPFTGRLQPGRRWSEGLHQAIEAKEGVAVRQESRTFASITYQNFFRMYKKLSGMTGTAMTSSEEFYKVYGLTVVAVPTNRPIARMDRDDLIFATEQGKFKAIARKIKELNQKGQPVLVGTVSVERNELLAEYLKREGVPHEVLNAKNNEREGEIVAQAGRKGAVTIATNMAGRGVDIKLGGNPATVEQSEEIKKLGGLFVLGTERHEARRIDNQLRGRSGRQGDPGETQFFVSMEDSLMRVFASDKVKNMMKILKVPEDEAIQNRLITRSLETAQKKIEGVNFDARKRVLEYDDVINTQRRVTYDKRREILVGDVGTIKTYIQKLVANRGNDFTKKFLAEHDNDEFYLGLRRMILQTFDLFWVDHLETMDYLRSSVGLRAYGQRDPLIEYRKEGLRLYKELQDMIEEKIVELIPHATGQVAKVEQPRFQLVRQGAAEAVRNIKVKQEVGRNDKVVIEKNGETRELKYKKAEPLLKEGWVIKEVKK